MNRRTILGILGLGAVNPSIGVKEAAKSIGMINYPSIVSEKPDCSISNDDWWGSS